MKKIFVIICNGFLALALLVGKVDASMISRFEFYQPPMPEALLKNQK